MTPKIPKVVVKSLFEYLKEHGSGDAVVEWLVANQGLDRSSAEFMFQKLKAANSVEEFNAHVNDEELDEPVKMSAQEMQMMQAGRAAVRRATAATTSKWPWE